MASTDKEESDRAKNYRYLYGRDGEEKVKYEIPELPLEDKIASVRKVVCKNWKKAEVKNPVLSVTVNAVAMWYYVYLRKKLKRLGKRQDYHYQVINEVDRTTLVGPS